MVQDLISGLKTGLFSQNLVGVTNYQPATQVGRKFDPPQARDARTQSFVPGPAARPLASQLGPHPDETVLIDILKLVSTAAGLVLPTCLAVKDPGDVSSRIDSH